MASQYVTYKVNCCSIEHLIFDVTSSHLSEEKFTDIQLETVLHCIKKGLISNSHVLLTIPDSCELQVKIPYNLPEVAANTHDWATVTKSSEIISQKI